MRSKLKIFAGASFRLLGTQHGRLLALVVVVGLVVAFLVRAQFIHWLGWSAVPLLGWLAVFLYLANGRPRLIVGWYRGLAAGLLMALAVSVALGMVASPGAFYANESLGGRVGELMARWPAEWDAYGVATGNYILAGVRVAVLVLLAGAVVWPRGALIAGRGAWIGAQHGARYGAAALAATAAWTAATNDAWREARAARGREKAAEAAASESMQDMTIVGAELVDDSLVLEPEPETVAEVDGYDNDDDEDVQDLVEADEFADIDDLDAAPDGPAPAAPSPSVAAVGIPPFPWKLPSMSLLKSASGGGVSKSELTATGELIVEALRQHAINVSIDQVRVGPTVTMYGLKPGWKGEGGQKEGTQRVRVDTILNREKDLALALASPNLRFEAPVPGESVVGIEVPNTNPTPVTVKSVMDVDAYKSAHPKMGLPVPLGLDSGGQPAIADLTRMPHVLVAGATGSGKSVCMNALIVGLLMNRTPEQVRMVMIDPKRVELTPYAGIPHLYTEPVVEPERAIVILRSLVQEMMERFRILESAGVRNIAAFNTKSSVKMPYLLIMVDELADLMLTGASDVERLLVRLAQLGRATGVHLVVATQRPSVDVVTGLIKANFPSRISFSVMSQIDSRTILDSPGAEKLLGKGDMLFLPVDKARPARVQGAFLGDDEVEAVVNYWRNADRPREMPMLEVNFEEEGGGGFEMASGGGDSLFDNAVSLAKTQRTLSTSLLQRRLRIGYPRAARLMDELEEEGVVGPGEAGKPRQVL